MLPPSSIPIKERASYIYLEYGQIDVRDGAFVLVDCNGVRTQIPVGGLACVLIGPGTSITHAAVVLAARVSCLLMWVGEEGVRLYASGHPGGSRSDRLLQQAAAYIDPEARLRVVRKMYALRFNEEAPSRRSIEQLRGYEGARVKAIYAGLAKISKVEWKGRRYDPANWEQADIANRALSVATSCLYGLSEAAILAAGYSPAIGFLHTGRPLAFVYDIADIIKFDTVVPMAFQIVARMKEAPFKQIETEIRQRCRDTFRTNRTLEQIVPLINEVIEAADVPPPTVEAYQLTPVLPEIAEC